MKTLSKLLFVWMLCLAMSITSWAGMESVTFTNHYFEFVGPSKALPDGMAGILEPYKLAFFQNGKQIAVDSVSAKDFRQEKNIAFDEHFNPKEPMTVTLQLPDKAFSARCMPPAALFNQPAYTHVSYDIQLSADNKTLSCLATVE